MDFRRYNSIENTYRIRYIDKWVSAFPELLTEEYCLTEKIDGANFSIAISEDEIKYGKRSSFLEEYASFFDYQRVVAKYEQEFKKVQAYLIKNNLKEIRLYGELFGRGIQARIDYGEEKQIKLFDALIDNQILSQKEFFDFLKEAGIENMSVPVIGVIKNLKTALEYDINFNTKINNKEGNTCEGIVIKPYRRVFQFKGGGLFYLKKKNEKFSEKNKTGKTKTDFVPSDKFLMVLDTYKSYINDNRLQSIFSKEGMIKDPSYMGEYIKLMLDDAREDFMKDHRDIFMELEDNERKRVFSATGRETVPLLRKYL